MVDLTQAAFILSFIAFLVTLYIWAEYRLLRKELQNQKINREKHARGEIYSILRSIIDVREWRERMRHKTDGECIAAGTTKEINTLFANKRVERVIKNLSLTLSHYNEYLPEKFIARVNDAINAYDFILNRLELLPHEIDDPSKILSMEKDDKGFIDELKKL